MNEENENEIKNIEGYLRLLLAFNALPHTKPGRTFMEVSGYPHYENVCSNILGFYFDTAAEHGFQDLFISAFLRMAEKESVNSGTVIVSREHPTAKGRIDLVIEGELFIIAIENKINHWLANDLEDYAKTIHSLAKENQIVIKAVLGLNLIKDNKALSGGFVSFTYKQLWQEVRYLLGNYIAQANPKWSTYLFDFMETTTNLAGDNMEIKQTDQFFIEHNDDIETMLTVRNDFLARLTRKIATLVEMIEKSPEVSALARPPYPYAKDRLVLDFVQLGGNYDISFDFYLTPAGWDLQLFGRGAESYDHLRELVKQPPLKEKMKLASLIEKRYYVQKWGVQADLDEIKNALYGWLAAIVEAENTFKGIQVT